MKSSKEVIKNIIVESGHELIGIIKILDYPYLKLKCKDCNHIFIVDIPTVLESNTIKCSKCFKVYNTVKTKHEWIRYFYDVNGEDLTPLEWIDNSHSEIKTRCNKCGNIWIRRARSDKGCPKCKGINRRVKARDVIERIKNINPNIEIITEILDDNNSEPLYHKIIDIRCSECGYEYSNTIQSLLSGSKCPNCSRKMSYEEFKSKVHSYSKVTVIGKYTDMKTKVLVKCNYCGKKWNADPKSIFYNKSGCSDCYTKTITSSVYDVRSKIKTATNDNIEMIGEYKNNYTETLFRCKKCGAEFYSKPKYMYSANADCINRCLLYTDISDKYKEKIYNKYSDEFYIEYLDDIFNYNGKVKLTCKKCGYSEVYTVSRLVNYPIKCSSCFKGSSLEKEVFDYVKSIYDNTNIECNRYFSYKGVVKELDIFIPELRLGIELDGLYWHSEKVAGKNKQIDKLNFFNNNYNIRVIFIREDEWISKCEIVKSRIKNTLSKISERYYARQCNIIELTKSQTDLFLNKYHIQGKDSSSIRLGLVQGNKLLSVMTFGKARNSMRSKDDESNNVYELLRFASRTNINVVGGFSKLFKYFLKVYNPNKIKTFADRRWSVGNVYEKNGFILDHISEPGYVYFKGIETYHRVQFQKHKLESILDNYNPNLSEYQNMLNNGYNRYWDCGQLVYYYTNRQVK